MIHWDIDHFEQLQESAWQLDTLASEQDLIAKHDGHRSDGEANRVAAHDLRDQAAHMLAQYWVLPSARRADTRRALSGNAFYPISERSAAAPRDPSRIAGHVDDERSVDE